MLVTRFSCRNFFVVTSKLGWGEGERRQIIESKAIELGVKVHLFTLRFRALIPTDPFCSRQPRVLPASLSF